MTHRTYTLFSKPGTWLVAILLAIFTLGAVGNLVWAQEGIPDVPNPPRLVNDLAGLLGQSEIQSLEEKLTRLNDSTGVQIAVVIVPTLNGYDPADFAQRLGQKWGVGGSKFDNGFVVLVKPKSSSEKGEAFIATGYGVEQYVPDATAWQIVNNEMIPYFRQNDYYGGIDAAIQTLSKFVKGEFTADSYGKSKGPNTIILVFIILLIIAILFIFRNRNDRYTINRGGGGPVIFPWIGGGGNSGGGGWSNWGGGGSSGGFGGFGGGGFGGGGAGGSW